MISGIQGGFTGFLTGGGPLSGPSKPAFDAIDSNGDRSISLGELKGAFASGEMGGGRGSTGDREGLQSGSTGRAPDVAAQTLRTILGAMAGEGLTARAEVIFNAMDADADGGVCPGEFYAFGDIIGDAGRFSLAFTRYIQATRPNADPYASNGGFSLSV